MSDVTRPPRYSILITSFRSLRFLEKCLGSLVNLTGPSYEVLFLDNGSPDPEAEWVENHIKDPRFRVFKVQHTGYFTGGVNFLAKHAQGEFLVLLNSDAYVKPDWLQELDTFLETTGYEGVAADIREMSHPEEPGNVTACLDPFGMTHLVRMDMASPPDLVMGGCGLVVRHSVFLEVGPLDGDYKMYFEDLDFCWRVGLRGYRIGYAPRATVYHAGQGSSAKSFFLWNRFRSRRNRVWTYVKNAGPLMLVVFIPSHVILSLLRVGGFFLIGRFRIAVAEGAGLAAAFFHLGGALSKRGAIQAGRKVTDAELVKRGFIVFPGRHLNRLFHLMFKNRKS